MPCLGSFSRRDGGFFAVDGLFVRPHILKCLQYPGMLLLFQRMGCPTGAETQRKVRLLVSGFEACLILQTTQCRNTCAKRILFTRPQCFCKAGGALGMACSPAILELARSAGSCPASANFVASAGSNAPHAPHCLPPPNASVGTASARLGPRTWQSHIQHLHVPVVVLS